MMNSENMKTTETLTQEETLIIQQKIYRFLSKQIILYTVGDSSSVTTDTAKELLTSITFVLELALAQSNTDHCDLLTAEIEDIFNEGQAIIRKNMEEGRALLELMNQTAPAYANEFYWATYRGIKCFFKDYNPLFFAHQIPGEIDYPLCLPVSETQLGIEYINDYLKRVILENHILNMFNSDLVSCLLTKQYVDFAGLPVNLCEPIIVNVVGLSMLGGDIFSLTVSSSSVRKISDLIRGMSKSELSDTVITDAENICSALNILENSQLEYVKQTALLIIPRIMTSEVNLSRIFIEI